MKAAIIAQFRERTARRGITLVYSLLLLVMLTGFTSLAVDWGRIQLVKTQLARSADAAARAAVSGLGTSVSSAQSMAVQFGGLNQADGSSVCIDSNNDVEFGNWDKLTRTFSTFSGASRFGANAVRVTARRTSARGNPTPMILGKTLGLNNCDVNGVAIAWRPGPIAWYRLNEIGGLLASDSGGVNTGSLVNSPGWTSAVYGNGLVFDGFSKYVVIPDDACFHVANALTITGWVKGYSWPNDSNWANVILRKGDANPNNWQLSIRQTYITLTLDDFDAYSISGNTSLALNTWYHVAGTWDGSVVKIYLNGVLDASPTARAGPIGTDTRPVYLGGRTGNTDTLNGVLDDVRLYNRALSAADINMVYQGGNP